MAGLRTRVVAAFFKIEIRPQLGEDFFVYKKRHLARMRGPFVQAALFAKDCSNGLEIIPTFYMAGANPFDPVLFQTMSLPITGMASASQWRFPPETPLDAELTHRLMPLAIARWFP
jgi:hypothetical protein